MELVGAHHLVPAAPQHLSFGPNAIEVEQFLAELRRDLDSRRAFGVRSGRTIAASVGYPDAERRVQAVAAYHRHDAWVAAREAADAIATAALDDSTMATQVVSIVSDVAGAIAVRDLISVEDFDLLCLPWTRRPRESAADLSPNPIAPEPDDRRISEEGTVTDQARVTDEVGLDEVGLDEVGLDEEWAAAVAEAGRIAEDARLASAEDARLANPEDEPPSEEARLEAERIAAAAEVERLAAEDRQAEDARLAEAARLQAERIEAAAEAERHAEEARLGEEARLREEARLAEEARVRAERTAAAAQAAQAAEEAVVAIVTRQAKDARATAEDLVAARGRLEAKAQRALEVRAEARRAVEMAAAERSAAEARLAEALRMAEAARVVEEDERAHLARVDADARRIDEKRARAHDVAAVAETERMAAEARLAEHAGSTERVQAEAARTSAAAEAGRLAAREAADRLAGFLAAEEAARAQAAEEAARAQASQEAARAMAARLASLEAAEARRSTPPRSMRQARAAAPWGVVSPRLRAAANSRQTGVAVVAVAVIAGRLLWRIARR